MNKVLNYRYYVYIALSLLAIVFMLFLPTLKLAIGSDSSTIGLIAGDVTYAKSDDSLLTTLYFLVTLVLPVLIIAVSVVAIVLKKDFLAFDIAIVSLFALQIIAIFAIFAPVVQSVKIADLKDSGHDALANIFKVVPAVGTILAGVIASVGTLASGGALTYKLVKKA